MNKKYLLIIIPIIFVVAYFNKSNQPAKQEHVDALVDKILPKYPELRPSYDEAMSDGVITNTELKSIVDKANAIKE